MSACCSNAGCASPSGVLSPRYRRVLQIALIINAAMFTLEALAGLHAGSVSLLADAVDFFGDAANYGISLLVLSMAAAWRARAALFKGLTMGIYGIFVIAQALWHAWSGVVPEAATMGAVGLLALTANLSVAALLYAYRDGDANMRSVWLCTRNDAIGNLAVLLAALGVWNSATPWPDVTVAAIMGVLGISAAISVIRQAHGELRRKPRPVGIPVVVVRD